MTRTTTLRALLLALPLALAALAPAAARAQADEGREASAAESRAASFQAVEGPPTEDVPGGGLLVAAYGAVLALLLLYVAWLATLQRRTERDLARLERAFASKTSADPSRQRS